VNNDDIPSFKSIDEEPVKKEKPVGRDIDKEVDKELLKIRDKIKLVDDVKTNPPRPGEMLTPIPEGTYAIDLNTLLAAQLVDAPGTVIPMLIDHGVRTAVDIKDTYKPERRVLDFQYWWVIFLVIGMIAMVFILNMIFKIF